jgi:hypothetical protein
METKRRIGLASLPEGPKRNGAAAKRFDGDRPMWPPMRDDLIAAAVFNLRRLR